MRGFGDPADPLRGRRLPPAVQRHRFTIRCPHNRIDSPVPAPSPTRSRRPRWLVTVNGMDDFLEVDTDTDAQILHNLTALVGNADEATPVTLGRNRQPEAVLITVPTLDIITPLIEAAQERPLNLHSLPVHAVPAQGAREFFSALLPHLARHRLLAEPALIEWGDSRRGVVISITLFEAVAAQIGLEDSRRTAAQRLGAAGDTDWSRQQFDAICADLGVDPAKVRQLREQEGRDGNSINGSAQDA